MSMDVPWRDGAGPPSLAHATACTGICRDLLAFWCNGGKLHAMSLQAHAVALFVSLHTRGDDVRTPALALFDSLVPIAGGPGAHVVFCGRLFTWWRADCTHPGGCCAKHCRTVFQRQQGGAVLAGCPRRLCRAGVDLLRRQIESSGLTHSHTYLRAGTHAHSHLNKHWGLGCCCCGSIGGYSSLHVRPACRMQALQEVSLHVCASGGCVRSFLSAR
jgi:hypothetical protein